MVLQMKKTFFCDINYSLDILAFVVNNYMQRLLCY